MSQLRLLRDETYAHVGGSHGDIRVVGKVKHDVVQLYCFIIQIVVDPFAILGWKLKFF